eukprot:SAG31_NODE_7093_length_1791_cov_0.833924_2_plen_184_part_00
MARAGLYGSAEVVFTECTLLNTGGTAARLGTEGFGAMLLSLDSSVVKNAGYGGVKLGGGDDEYLTPSGILIQNTSFANFSRRKRTDVPAIGWTGVGHVVRHNAIDGAPHSAMQGVGNDCLFEGNVIRNAVFECDDAGACTRGLLRVRGITTVMNVVVVEQRAVLCGCSLWRLPNAVVMGRLIS